MISDLDLSLGSRYFLNVANERLGMFLSRLNEISGGCKKILPVSGSFQSNLKFFRLIDFTAWL